MLAAAEAGSTHKTSRTTAARRPALALVAALLLAVTAAGCMPADANKMLIYTNQARAYAGIRPVQEHPTLTAKAESWARHMAAEGRLSHSTLSAGLGTLNWRSLGENVGYSSPTSNTLWTIHVAFVRSAGHRANILNPKYTHMGVGVHKDSQGRVWVAEVFAQL